MPQSCDMGQTALLPLRGKAWCGFFRPKNPTTSDGFEPVILGNRGQHGNHWATEAALLNVAFENPETIPAENKWKQRWCFTGQVSEIIS
jgi:hypothetical protein